MGITGGGVIPARGHSYMDYCTGEMNMETGELRYVSICGNCQHIQSEWWSW